VTYDNRDGGSVGIAEALTGPPIPGHRRFGMAQASFPTSGLTFSCLSRHTTAMDGGSACIAGALTGQSIPGHKKGH